VTEKWQEVNEMINVNKLRGIIAEQNLSQRKVAKHLCIREKTFYEKMKKGVFKSDEIAKMIRYLDISNPMEIFFA